MSNTNLWIMVGIPGSGKSYFAKNILMTDDSWQYISRDEVRFSIVKENEPYFSKEYNVFEDFCDRIIYALGCDEYHNVIADATHLDEKSRMKLINRVDPIGMGANVFCVFVNTPEYICQERNKQRQGRTCVPEKAVEKMYHSLRHPAHDKFKYAGVLEVSGV